MSWQNNNSYIFYMNLSIVFSIDTTPLLIFVISCPSCPMLVHELSKLPKKPQKFPGGCRPQTPATCPQTARRWRTLSKPLFLLENNRNIGAITQDLRIVEHTRGNIIWTVRRRRRRKFWGNTPLMVRKRCLERLPKPLNSTTPTDLISPYLQSQIRLFPQIPLISLFPQIQSKIRLFPQVQLTPPHPRGGYTLILWSL